MDKTLNEEGAEDLLEEEEEKTLVSHFPPLTPDLGYPATLTWATHRPTAQWDRRIISLMVVQHPVEEDMTRIVLEWNT